MNCMEGVDGLNFFEFLGKGWGLGGKFGGV